jgi:Mg-chelatase subunit ChlD
VPKPLQQLYPHSVRAALIFGAWAALNCGADPGALGSREGSRNGASSVPAGTGSPSAGTNALANPTQTVIAKSDSTPISTDGACSNPTVLFVIDGSGSMSENFGGPSRWQALRTALLDPMTGFITRFHDKASFGLLIYDGTIDTGSSSSSTTTPATGAMMCPSAMSAMSDAMCPRLVSVAPMFSNLKAIDPMYPAKELGGSTPTDKALAAAVEQVTALTAGKDPSQNPGFIILATDGEPNDLCFGGKGGDGSLQRQCVISAVDRAAAAKIRTFVISLAGMDKKLQEHLVEVAKHGDPANPMAHPYSPMNPNELVMALKTVLTAAVGCDLK